MAVKVQLNDGVALLVEVGLDEMSKAYETALEGNSLLEIRSGDGTIRRVNPHQILYFEEAPAEEEAERPVPAREAAGSR